MRPEQGFRDAEKDQLSVIMISGPKQPFGVHSHKLWIVISLLTGAIMTQRLGRNRTWQHGDGSSVMTGIRKYKPDSISRHLGAAFLAMGTTEWPVVCSVSSHVKMLIASKLTRSGQVMPRSGNKVWPMPRQKTLTLTDAIPQRHPIRTSGGPHKLQCFAYDTRRRL
jgi:hypothetical protein